MDGTVTPLCAKLPFAPMLRHFPKRLPPLLVAALLSSACGATSDAPRDTKVASPRGEYLFVFAGHADHAMHGDPHAPSPGDQQTATPDALRRDSASAPGDFMAVIDVDSTSPTFAQVVATTLTGAAGAMPHHTEMLMPDGGRPLAANAFIGNVTYLFDFTDPRRPRLTGRVDSVPGFGYAHSFARLPNGDLLGTLQFGDGTIAGNPGGLARFDANGRLLRAVSAADPALPGKEIRTYSLDVNPTIDRVITTSIAMNPAITTTADVVQIHRLSDLSLVKTLTLPPTVRDSTSRYPFEVRFLANGTQALLNTIYCGFYLIEHLDSDAPTLTPVLALPHPQNIGCAVPQRIGHWWIMPVESQRHIVVFDVRDPRRPQRTAVLQADSTFTPHWIARDPHSDRLVVTAEGPRPAVRLARFDSLTGAIRWEERFRETPDGPPGVSFARTQWPHGKAGRAAPHGAVFSRR